MSAELQIRAKAFLQRQIPKDFQYVSGSISERIITSYASDGMIDPNPELAELLSICVFEAFESTKRYSGDVSTFFRESGEILQSIEAELQKSHE